MDRQKTVSNPPLYRTVLVLSEAIGSPKGSRECPNCRAKWTIAFPGGHGGDAPSVTRNGEPANASVLDHWGNNAAVQCC